MRQDNEPVIFNREFERKIFAGTGFEPLTFLLSSSGPADFPSLRYRPPSFVSDSWPQLGCHQQLGVHLQGAVASNRLLTPARSTQSVQVQKSRIVIVYNLVYIINLFDMILYALYSNALRHHSGLDESN